MSTQLVQVANLVLTVAPIFSICSLYLLELCTLARFFFLSACYGQKQKLPVLIAAKIISFCAL